MIAIDVRQFRRLARWYPELSRTQMRFASMQAINDVAFDGKRAVQDDMDQKLELRNAWTKKSVQVDKATPRELTAEVGSVAEYVERLTLGGRRHGSGGKTVAVITPQGTREGRRNVRRRPGTGRTRRISSLPFHKPLRPSSVTQSIAEAKRAGKNHVLLKIRRKVAVYRIEGRAPNFTIEMVFDLSQRKPQTPAFNLFDSFLAGAEQNYKTKFNQRLSAQLARMRGRI